MMDALAGFRVGYGFAHEDLINNLLKVKEIPFEPSIKLVKNMISLK